VAVAKLKETPILLSLPLHIMLVAMAMVKLKETPILPSLPLQLLLPSSLVLNLPAQERDIVLVLELANYHMPSVLLCVPGL